MTSDQTLLMLGYVVVAIIVLLWILLPFAVFGLKGLVRELIQEQRTTNELLRREVKTEPPA